MGKYANCLGYALNVTGGKTALVQNCNTIEQLWRDLIGDRLIDEAVRENCITMMKQVSTVLASRAAWNVVSAEEMGRSETRRIIGVAIDTSTKGPHFWRVDEPDDGCGVGVSGTLAAASGANDGIDTCFCEGLFTGAVVRQSQKSIGSDSVVDLRLVCFMVKTG